MGITAEYNTTAGRVVIDENEGHPGIKATTLSYGQINDEMLAMLDKPRPSYYLLAAWILDGFGPGCTKLCYSGRCGDWLQRNQSSHRLGFLYHELRFLDWDWSRRDFDFCGILSDPRSMAYCNLPKCRSHDRVCRVYCRTFSSGTHWTPLACFLADSLSE